MAPILIMGLFGMKRLLRGAALVFGALAALAISEGFFRWGLPGYVHTYPRGFFLSDDELGHCLAPSFRGEFRATRNRIPLTTNSWGFRDVEHPPQDMDASTRILVIGDSFTMGPDVALEDIWPRALEARLSSMGDVAVFSLAVGGYGTAQEVLLARKWIRTIDPHVVILQFFANDIFDNLQFESRAGCNEACNREEEGERLKRSWLKELAGRSYLIGSMASLVGGLRSTDGWLLRVHRCEVDSETADGLAITARLLGDFATLSNLQGAAPIVVLIPHECTVTAESFRRFVESSRGHPEEYDRKVLHRRIAAISAGAEVFCLDLLPVFEGSDSIDLYNRHDPHLNRAGHKLVAGCVATTIVRRGLVPAELIGP